MAKIVGVMVHIEEVCKCGNAMHRLGRATIVDGKIGEPLPLDAGCVCNACIARDKAASELDRERKRWAAGKPLKKIKG